MLYATLKNKSFGEKSISGADTAQDSDRLLQFCSIPRSRLEMMEFMGLTDKKHFREHYVKPLLASEKLLMTIPDKPQSKNQRYISTHHHPRSHP